MKIPDLSRVTARKRENGMAVIVMLILLGLVLAFVVANFHTLSDLHGELKRVEQKQIRRINNAGTNTVSQSTAARSMSAP
jgi:hypothetical protein